MNANGRSLTSAIGGVCNCPTGGCECTTVRRYVTSSGTTYVITVHSNTYDDNSIERALKDFQLSVPLARLPFYRLARARKVRPSEGARPDRPRPMGGERVDWARLPRRSPRRI